MPVTASVHLGEGGDGASANSTTTIHAQEGDQQNSGDNSCRGEQASSTVRHQEDNRPSSISNESNKPGHESDGADSEIEINQGSADTATTTIDAPEHVTNHGELRSFVNHIVKEDSHITDVHVSSSTVETHYETPAKFLWAIPTTLTADVSVQSDGSVTVTYPWYSFLFGTNGDIAAQLQQSVASSSTGSSTTLSANAQAHLLNLLFSVLKGSN